MSDDKFKTKNQKRNLFIHGAHTHSMRRRGGKVAERKEGIQ